MGKFSYEEQGTYTWLVYQAGEDEEMDSLSLGMLSKNKIPGIMPIIYTSINNADYVKYDISTQISVGDYLKGMMDRESVLGIFLGVLTAFVSAENYMLDVNSLALDMDYIFVDASTKETRIVCVPVRVRERKRLDLAGFFKNILVSVQFDPSAKFDFEYKQIINYLNSPRTFSVAEFRKMILQLYQPEASRTSHTPEANPPQPPMTNPPQSPAPKPPMPAPGGNPPIPPLPEPPKPRGDKPVESLPGFDIPTGNGGGKGEDKRKDKESKGDKKNKKEGKGILDIFGRRERISKSPAKGGKEEPKPPVDIHMGNTVDDDGYPGHIGETLEEDSAPALILRYVTENRTIEVNRFPFEIGREGSGLRIDAAKVKVSRRHAVITQAGNQFLLTDFSKSGTYINGEKIPKGNPRTLENGMRILLKTEEFEVQIHMS